MAKLEPSNEHKPLIVDVLKTVSVSEFVAWIGLTFSMANVEPNVSIEKKRSYSSGRLRRKSNKGRSRRAYKPNKIRTRENYTGYKELARIIKLHLAQAVNEFPEFFLIGQLRDLYLNNDWYTPLELDKSAQHDGATTPIYFSTWNLALRAMAIEGSMIKESIENHPEVAGIHQNSRSKLVYKINQARLNEVSAQ